MVRPVSATSSGLPVSISAPCFMLAPRTSPRVIARASMLGPFSVIGSALSSSARKPMVCALAMLLAMTCSVIIEPERPE
jgi:hypothetical protein